MPLRLLRQIIRIGTISEPPPTPAARLGTAGEAAAIATHEAHAIQAEILALLGHALAIRQVDAGSCNGCELEIQALNSPYYNLEGIGIKFVASPRHADLLLVTGPVSAHMEAALRRTYDAVPTPKRVVAVGECGGNGGVFGESYACRGRVANVIPVDVEVAGCPPAPVDILRAIRTAIGGGAGVSTIHADPPPHASFPMQPPSPPPAPASERGGTFSGCADS